MGMRRRDVACDETQGPEFQLAGAPGVRTDARPEGFEEETECFVMKNYCQKV